MNFRFALNLFRGQLAGARNRLGNVLFAPLLLLAGAGAGGAEPPAPQPEAMNLAALTLDQLIEVKVGAVYGASKYWQGVAQAPAHVSIVTGEEIKLHGHRNLGEALRSVAGLSVSYDRNYSYLGIRGFNRGDYNSHVLVLIDGHRLNDNLQDSALIGNEFILDVDLIDRVEVIRGPGSSVYGNNAFFGVINVITRNGRSIDGVEFSGDAGSFDTYKGRFSAGKKYENGFEFLFSGSYFNSAGPDKLFYKEYDAPESNNGVAHEVDGETYHNFFAAATWRGFTLEGGFNDREKVIPTGSYSTVFNSPRNRTIDARAFASLKFQHSFESGLDLTARAHYDYSRYDGDYLYDLATNPPPPELVLNVDRFLGESFGGELQAGQKFWDRLTLAAGAEFRESFRQDQRNFNVEPRTEYFTDRRSSWNAGIHAQGELAVLTNLTFTAGLRYDYASMCGSSVNPRLALVFAPAPCTTLKFLYGTAYRAPNPSELFYNDGEITTKANPNLRPETIATYQVVWQQQLPGDFLLSLSGFYYQIDDLISYATDPADDLLVFRNLEEVEAKGAEVELEKNWSSGLRLRASYTYQDATDRQTGEWLNRSPHHLAKLNVAVPLLAEKIFVGGEAQFHGKSRTLADAQSPAYCVVNATLFSQKLIKGSELSAGVYNLFDKRYGHPSGSEHSQDLIAQDGRAFRVKLTWRF